MRHLDKKKSAIIKTIASVLERGYKDWFSALTGNTELVLKGICHLVIVHVNKLLFDLIFLTRKSRREFLNTSRCST